MAAMTHGEQLPSFSASRKASPRRPSSEAEEVERDTLAQTYLHSIARDVEQLALAYNKAANREVLKVTDRIKQPSPRVQLEFEGGAIWMIVPNTHNRQSGSLKFVRVEPRDGSANFETMVPTADSIVFVVEGDEFWVSLHEQIPSAIRVNVTDHIKRRRQPIEELKPRAKELLRKIIEYQLLPKQ